MSTDKLVILVTGGVASGKTTFLERLRAQTARWWRGCGFISIGETRERGSGTPAASYHISVVGQSGRLPWAKRSDRTKGFAFCEATRLEVRRAVGARLDSNACDLCFLDEIGHLELGGQGFAELFRQALGSTTKVVIAAVRTSLLGDVVREFDISQAVVIDLDRVSAEQGLRNAKRSIVACDAVRIGAFAGIGGLMEVGLGSTLHAYRVPFKGHVLAYLQNGLLIAFGKTLQGRGLIRISFISAMLKAFSPVGSRFRPMAYIFLQGLSFAAPIRFFGWNIASVLLGSVIMSWLTLALSLLFDYVTFGRSIFDAFGGAINSASSWIGVQGPSLTQVLVGAFVLKAMIALALGAAAYLGNLQPLVRRLGKRRVRPVPKRHSDHDVTDGRCSLGSTALGALGDLVRPRFMIAFIISALLILFFAGISKSDFMSLLLRGLCISYLGFVAMRRINLCSLGEWLDRRAGLGLGMSLPVAFGVLKRPQPEPPSSRASKASCQPGSQALGNDAHTQGSTSSGLQFRCGDRRGTRSGAHPL